jgi:predicted DNA-binding transcriptional regulator AlpA
MATQTDTLLKTAEVEDMLGLARNTIAKGRCVGRISIPFIRLSPKAIRYRRSDVERFIASRTVTPTTPAI